jgi:SAM-dependent methyltransferase
VLAHVPALNDFVAAIRRILRPSGIAVIEVPYARPLIEHREFDTIYHEHLSYFSVTALDALFRRHALTLTKVVPLSVHGGSLRLFLSPVEGAPVEESVRRFSADEAALGLNRIDYYRDFATKVGDLKDQLRHVLRDLKARGKTIAGYGAAAKGSTLLNFAGIGTETLDYIVDRNPQKHGRYFPGVHIPILPVGTLEERRPDVILILTWNFANEILEQLAPLRSRGCQFLIPIPDVRFV